MKQKHTQTLQALFQHPLTHNLRMDEVEALLVHLDAKVEHLSDHRLKVQLPSGEILILHALNKPHHSLLNEDNLLRLRRFLQQAGITPSHAEVPGSHTRGDQSKRLVIHLDRRGAQLWWLEGDTVESSTLKPHGLWSSHQRMSHRHDRDVAGQRAPLDYDYLNELCAAAMQADRVLLLSHGHGESDLRQIFKEHMQTHHPSGLDRLEITSVDDTAKTENELLGIARRHFGNQPHRRTVHTPGQPTHEAGSRS